MNALAELTAQHRQIEELLARARDRDRGAITALADFVPLHLAVEQELVYGRLAAQLPRAVLAELHVEHTEIRRVLAELCWLEGEGAGIDDIAPRLAALAGLLEGHSAWQDRELFETLPERLGAASLRDLESSVRAAFDVHALAA